MSHLISASRGHRLPGQRCVCTDSVCHCGSTHDLKDVVGEADSFGYEVITLCSKCRAEAAQQLERCEFCHKDKADCAPRPSCDSGDVYLLCGDCHRTRNVLPPDPWDDVAAEAERRLDDLIEDAESRANAVYDYCKEHHIALFHVTPNQGKRKRTFRPFNADHHYPLSSW